MADTSIIILVSSLLIGAIAGVAFSRRKKINIQEVRAKAEEIIRAAGVKAKENLENAKTQTGNIKNKIIENLKKYEEFLKDIEKSVRLKEETLNKREKKLEEFKLQQAQEEEKFESARKKHEEIKLEQIKLLSDKAGKNTEDAKEQIVKELDENLKNENKDTLKKLEEYYTDNAEKQARNILLESMQKILADTSTEKRSAQICVPKDHLKAELVGDKGENIKELETLLEIDVIFNDFPDTISISSYSPLQRHIAEITINKLFEKKHITPQVIREAVKYAAAEADKDIYKIGLAAIKKLGINKNIPQELVQIIGRLYFRTSYGQNIMRHSMEVSYIAALLGGELGLDMDICKISGFLHDLGKAIDQDPGITGGHDQLTKELMTKFGFTGEEIHAAWTHHEAEPAATPEAMIVKAADAISAGRPGARQESIEKYIERIKALEEIPMRYQGVKKAFAISAGKEIRIIVEPSTVTDEKLENLAKEIAGNIEKEVGYPGKVKVNVIRRIFNTEYAK